MLLEDALQQARILLHFLAFVALSATASLGQRHSISCGNAIEERLLLTQKMGSEAERWAARPSLGELPFCRHAVPQTQFDESASMLLLVRAINPSPSDYK